MRTVAISCIRDELDIVEPFVRHTLAHVQHLVILDNGSTDGTRQLLQQLVEEGLPLEVVDDPSQGNYQWRRTTHLMRTYALEKYSADWIIPLDVDEFLVAENLTAYLQRQPSDALPIGMVSQTFVPDSRDDAAELNPVVRIRHRLRQEARTCIKVLIPGERARRPHVGISQGSHFIEEAGTPIATAVPGDLFLAHFPGRSWEQLARKVAVKHLQYLAMSDRQQNWGWHYQAKVEMLRRDLASLETSFQQTILRYNLPAGMSFEPELISAPLDYRGGPLKNTPAQSERPLVQSILECAETIARSHSSLAKEQAQLRAGLNDLGHELQQRDAVIAAFQQSWSWLIGRALTSPARWLKQRLRKAA